jgi:gas vesicle protein
MGEREEMPAAGLSAEGELMGEKVSRSGMIAGFVLGTIVGAGLALLLAPDSGQETRRLIGRRVRALRKDAIEGVEQAEAHARRRMRRGRRDRRQRFR